MAVVPHDQHILLAQGFGAFHPVALALAARQDRVADGLEGLGHQGRADGAGRIAAAEGQQAAAPAHRHRRFRQQVAHQIEDVFQVVGLPQAGNRMGDQARHILFAQADRPADAGVEGGVLGERHRDHPFGDVRLDQHRRVRVAAARQRIADEQAGVGPGRLGQVLDGHADPPIALDQQHVAGTHDGTQPAQIDNGKGLVGVAPRLVQECGQPPSDLLRQPVEHGPPPLVSCPSHSRRPGGPANLTSGALFRPQTGLRP